jgi:hypothetical protein
MKAMPIDTCKSFREIFHKAADPSFDPLDLRFRVLRYFLLRVTCLYGAAPKDRQHRF